MSYHREGADYSIQQVERAENQGFGEHTVEKVFANRLVIVGLILIIALLYHTAH